MEIDINSNEFEAENELWDNGTLGRDERYVGVVNDDPDFLAQVKTAVAAGRIFFEDGWNK